MATRHERYDDMFKTAVEKRLGERPSFLVTGSRIGSWSALMTTEVLAGIGSATGSPLRGWVSAPGSAVERRNGKRSKLPANFLVTLMTEDVLLLEYRQRLTRFIAIKDELGRFPRKTLEAVATNRRVTRRFALNDPLGEQFVVFEMFRNHPVTEEFTQRLGARIVDSPEQLDRS